MTDGLGHVMTRSRWRDPCERAEVGWGVREEGVVRLRVGGTDDGGVSESLGCEAERRGGLVSGSGVPTPLSRHRDGRSSRPWESQGFARSFLPLLVRGTC